MRRFILSLLCIACAGCTQLPQISEVQPYFNDAAFRAPAKDIRPEDVLAIDDTMQTYLAKEVLPKARRSSPQRALYDALSSSEHLKLDYDTEKTRNAREAFAAKSGNCLSLVILTAALARQMDIKVFFQDVQVPLLWARNKNLHFTVNHVNIILGNRRPLYEDPMYGPAKMRMPDLRFQEESLLVDFLPVENLRNQRARPIEVHTILAMYFNNRAFELLSNQQIDDAYWHIRAAIKVDPGYLSSLNTLGVIYRRQGDLARAERIFRDLIAHNDRNTMVLSNLIDALQSQGKTAEAEKLSMELRRLQKIAPFENFDRGMSAMAANDYKAARRYFEKEIEHNPDYDESHFWLALALLRSGETSLAVDELQLAKKYSTTFSSHQMYSNKLERLKAALAK